MLQGFTSVKHLTPYLDTCNFHFSFPYVSNSDIPDDEEEEGLEQSGENEYSREGDQGPAA